MSQPLVIKKPIVTEKSTDLNKIGKYVFMVAPSATKNEIKKAIHAFYKVDVVAVAVITRPPKTRRYRGLRAKRGGYKKAIITLKRDQKIDIE